MAITAVSLTPQDALPPLPDINDKIEHGCAYAGLAMLGGIAWCEQRARIAVAIGLAILGVALEAGQSAVPGRSAEFGDAIANTIGIAIGVAPFLLRLRRGRSA